MSRARKRWDIFCKVVDNFGDAGVAWRLARILAAEHGLAVTLWIDALEPLARMAPAIAIDREEQSVDGVTVRRQAQPMPLPAPADVVVDAFVGGLPPRYVDAMALRMPPPRWFQLEYLALEPGLDSHHGLPSPHPRLPLARTFWFPGFTARTGGLLRERGLLAARDAFAADAPAQRLLWSSLGVAPPGADEMRISMFCYPQAPLDALFAAWRNGAVGVTCVVPSGVASDALARFAQATPSRPRTQPLVSGRLTLASVPFVAQDAYDRLLWSCDVNFVRGEDSFVRAQWAARPFAWHAYPQADSAHAAKIAAFVDRYAHTLASDPAEAVRGLFAAWNALPGAPAIDAAWRAFAAQLPALREHASRWSLELERLPELAAGLVKASENRL